MKSFYIVLFVTFLFHFSDLKAQLNFVSYGSSNQVNALCEDGNYVWVGTNLGLYKRHKNGTLIANYSQENSGLANNTVKALALDFNNKLWIGTTQGLVCYNTVTNSWETFDKNNSDLPGNDITSIAVDGNGTKWIGVAPVYDLVNNTFSGGGIVKYDNSTWILFDNTNTPMTSNYITSIAIEASGVKWFATTALWDGLGGGILRYDNSGWALYDTSNSGIPGNYVTSVAIDGNGVKWIGTDFSFNFSGYVCPTCGGGLVKFDDVNWVTYDTSNSGLTTIGVTSVKIGNNGEIWVGTHSSYDQNLNLIGGGVYKFDGNNWTAYDTSNSGIPHNFVLSMIIDGIGNKWIGTVNGLSVLDDNNWTTYNSNSGINHFFFNRIRNDLAGNTWLGTYNGIYKYSGSSWNYYSISNSGLPDNVVYDFCFDQNNNIWIATENGLANFDGTNWQVFNSSNTSITDNFIHSVSFANGILWAGTHSGGLMKFDGSTWEVFNASNSGLLNDSIRYLTTEQNGNVWIYSLLSGLTKFDGTTWTNYNSSNSGLPSNEIYTIYKGHNGPLWICTTNGLASFDGSAWQTYDTTNSDLPSNTIYDFITDPAGYSWIGTGYGLVKTNFSDWLNYNTKNSGISSDLVVTIAVDSAFNLWAGTWDILDNGFLTRAWYESPETDFESDTACFPSDSTNFTDLSEKTDVFTQYKWDIGNDGTVDYTTKNPYHTFNAAGIYEVKLTASNMNLSDSLVKNIIVGIIPDVSISANSSLYLCSGNSVTLSATDQNVLPELDYRYLWSEGSTTKDITVMSTGDYSVTISDYNCYGASDSVFVYVQDAFADEQICLVTIDTATWKNKIIVEKTPGTGTSAYYVYKEISTNFYTNIGVIPFDSSGVFVDVQSVPESHGDKYKISVVDTCGNESVKSFYHKTMNLVVSSVGTTMGLSWTPYEDESGTFVPSKYYIYKGTTPYNMLVVDSVSGSFTSYNDNNVFDYYYYMVGVEKDYPCNTMLTRRSFSNKKQTPTGIDEVGYHGTILISPNPMSTSATLTIPNFEARNPKHESGISSDFEFRISDLTGKVVRVENITPSRHSGPDPESSQFIIERGDLKPGVYFVELNAGRSYRGKLVVE